LSSDVILLDLVSRQEQIAQTEQSGLKRHYDAVDSGTDVDEEGRKLIIVSTKKLKRWEGSSRSDLRQALLVNSVIEQCKKRRRREIRAVYARSRDASGEINERPKRIPFTDITNIINFI